jgi:hypothetical protein
MQRTKQLPDSPLFYPHDDGFIGNQGKLNLVFGL